MACRVFSKLPFMPGNKWATKSKEETLHAQHTQPRGSGKPSKGTRIYLPHRSHKNQAFKTTGLSTYAWKGIRQK